MDITKLTGLEVLQAMQENELAHPSICNIIPMSIAHVEKSKITFHVTANENHLNSMGGIHGGFSATVLDTVTGCAVHTLLDAGISYATIDLSIKMIRPIPKDEILIAEGILINLSKSLGISEGTIKTDDGKLLATATATCMILK
jgi:uncharacterized protein (TIGR00369 family)